MNVPVWAFSVHIEWKDATGQKQHRAKRKELFFFFWRWKWHVSECKRERGGREGERDAFHLPAVAVYLRTQGDSPKYTRHFVCILGGKVTNAFLSLKKSKLKRQKSGYCLLCNAPSSVCINSPVFLFPSSSLSFSENPPCWRVSLCLSFSSYPLWPTLSSICQLPSGSSFSFPWPWTCWTVWWHIVIHFSFPLRLLVDES